MKSIKRFIMKYIIPQHSNHMIEGSDLTVGWNYCKEHYGDFSLQLFSFKKDKHRVYLPPTNLFQKMFLQYLDDPSESDNFFKTQWILSEYLTVGWKYPVQTIWNWRMRWWEIHPGHLRGLIYNLFNVQEWLAWYQPMDNKIVDFTKTFVSPEEIYNYFSDCHHISAHVINYFNKPVMTICIHVTDNSNSTKLHKNIFQKHIKQGINIKGNDVIIDQVKREVSKWPDNYIKNKIVYNADSNPSLTIKKFNKVNFYVGLYLFGSTITEFNQLDLIYRNNK